MASPNAIEEINSPLPRLIGYLYPLSGNGYATSMSVFLTANPSSLNLAIFELRIKQKTLFNMYCTEDFPKRKYKVMKNKSDYEIITQKFVMFGVFF